MVGRIKSVFFALGLGVATFGIGSLTLISETGAMSQKGVKAWGTPQNQQLKNWDDQRRRYNTYRDPKGWHGNWEKRKAAGQVNVNRLNCENQCRGRYQMGAPTPWEAGYNDTQLRMCLNGCTRF